MAKRLNDSRQAEMEQREEIAKQDAERHIQEVLGSEPEREPVLDGLKSLEAELGLEGVELDQAAIDTVAAEDLSEGSSGRSSASQYHEASPILTGGDVDANYEQANAVGDEAVGGTAATPDQDVVDQLGAAVGMEMDDRAFLRTEEMLLQRDDRRWEMDPTSSEDYEERREA